MAEQEPALDSGAARAPEPSAPEPSAPEPSAAERGARERGASEPREPYRRSDRHRKRREAARAARDYFLIALIALALGKALMSRMLGLHSASLLGILLECSTIVLVLGLADLLWKRRSYTIDLAAYTVLSLVMLANVMYVSFFGEIFSPHLLSVVGQAGEVGDSIKSILKPVYLLYVLDIPVLAAWAAFTWRIRRESPARKRGPVAAVAGIALVALALQVAFVLALPADADSASVAKVRGFGAYQLASLVRLAMPDPSASTAAALAHEKNLTPAQAAQAQIDALRNGDKGAALGGVKFGQYKGKNVIILQVEALQDLVIGKSWAGKQITPNLNKLVADSRYFPNTYSETSAGNTVDAEFTVNTSLYSPTNGAASLEYADRELPGLPRLLRAQGYDAVTLHVNDIRFWNRIELYPALGFRQYWDRSYFKNRDKMWHASDQALFSMSMPVLKSEAASSAPFYSFLITESSHSPFKAIPMARRPLRFDPAQEKTGSGMYIGAISYTDLAIGEFVADLKKSGLWDNSILVIYGDHSALLDKGPNPGDSAIADSLLGRPYGDVDRQRIPLIVHLPGQKAAEESTKPVGQVDIMPTVAELVGLDLSQTPHLGRSAFVDAPALIPTRAYLNGGSFVDDSVVYVPGLSFDDGTALDLNTGQIIGRTPKMRAEYLAAKKLGLISDAWIKSLPKRADATGGKNAIIPH